MPNPIPITEQIACIKRELFMLKRVHQSAQQLAVKYGVRPC